MRITSLATNASGGTHSQMRYTPWGQQRWASGSIPSSYRFTDQRQESGVELYDYGARLYSPLLARFIPPDAIVPRPGDVQAFNRYGYARWNPMTRLDANGHADRDPQRDSLCKALPMMCAPQSPPLAGNGAQVTLFAAKRGGDGNDGKVSGWLRRLDWGVAAPAGIGWRWWCRQGGARSRQRRRSDE